MFELLEVLQYATVMNMIVILVLPGPSLLMVVLRDDARSVTLSACYFLSARHTVVRSMMCQMMVMFIVNQGIL